MRESESDPMMATTSEKRTDEYRQTEDSFVSKNVIVRLLGNKLAKPLSYQGASASSTTTSSLRGTPCRKLSACSRDSCHTRVSVVSACSSYEKLRDEFEIVSEAASVACTPSPGATMANTPNDTLRSVLGRRASQRRYASCDLDSLYESIRVLDSYLARRNLNVAQGHRQSVAVMLFGTPKHGTAHHPAGSSQRMTRKLRQSMRARIWRSSEDALSS